MGFRTKLAGMVAAVLPTMLGCGSTPGSQSERDSPTSQRGTAPTAEELAALESYEKYRTDYYTATVEGLAGEHREPVEQWGARSAAGTFADVAAIPLDDGSFAYTTVGLGAPVMGNGQGFEFVTFADSFDREVGNTLLAIGFGAENDPVPLEPYHRYGFSGENDDNGPTRFFLLDGGRGPQGHAVHRIVVVPVSLSLYEQYVVGVAEGDTPQAIRILGLGEGRPVLMSLPARLRAGWK